jgi:EF hand
MPHGSAQGFRLERAIVEAAAWILLGVVSLAAQGEQVFKGEVTDCMCSGPVEHTVTLEKNGTTAPCTIACANKGAKYVLSNPETKTVYQLDNQRKGKAFAGKNVVVMGTLDETTGTIHVSDMFGALSPKVTEAKSVYIVCDACLRGMAAAKPAASQELADWGRFDVLPNSRNADLVVLFSANPYLGDYGIRDGPDTRPVHVDITYMNVVDPRTGESLWGDSRQWGSWFVSKATKDLIAEFREQLEAGDGQAERMLFRMDRDRDGGVSKQEFLDYMAAEFDRLDTNKDGKLDADELRQLRMLNADK